MQLIPITTRTLMPPRDDLRAVLAESLTDVQENDIILIASKVVAIDEGHCVPIAEADEHELITREADLVIPRDYWSSPLTIAHGIFISRSGIDKSNANRHYVLLPEDPFASAKWLHAYLKKTHKRQNLGVVIVDSHSTPLRRGAMGVAIGWWGFAPLVDHRGKLDLFGRPFKVEVSNLVDGLAAAATLVLGETNESTPVVVARDVPQLSFTERDTKHDVLVPFEQDSFRVLYERFLSQ